MAQEYIVIHDITPKETDLHEALTKCSSCSKIVPKTMLCLYCGAPILYREPKEE